MKVRPKNLAQFVRYSILYAYDQNTQSRYIVSLSIIYAGQRLADARRFIGGVIMLLGLDVG